MHRDNPNNNAAPNRDDPNDESTMGDTRDNDSSHNLAPTTSILIHRQIRS